MNHTTIPEKKAEEDLLNEYEAMLEVEKNTRQHWYSDGWNLFGVATFILACVAFYVSYKSLKYTKKRILLK